MSLSLSLYRQTGTWDSGDLVVLTCSHNTRLKELFKLFLVSTRSQVLVNEEINRGLDIGGIDPRTKEGHSRCKKNGAR